MTARRPMWRLENDDVSRLQSIPSLRGGCGRSPAEDLEGHIIADVLDAGGHRFQHGRLDREHAGRGDRGDRLQVQAAPRTEEMNIVVAVGQTRDLDRFTRHAAARVGGPSESDAVAHHGPYVAVADFE